MSSRPEVRTLVAEGDSGCRRNVLRIFFQSAELVLAETTLPYNERAPSAHQQDRAGILETIAGKCRSLTKVGSARTVIVPREDSGFFSGFLIVLDALLFAPPEAEVVVDWRLHGNEGHFKYQPARPGECVWSSVFEPVHRHPHSTESTDASPYILCERFNMLLAPRFRWLARGTACEAAQRAAYHHVFRRHVLVAHPQVHASLRGLGATLRSGLSLGVHKRVYNPGTAEYQGSRTLPSLAGYVEATRRAVSRLEARRGQAVRHIYLATDDDAAAAYFGAAFGTRLVVRDGVERASGGLNADASLNEVHVASPHNRYECGLRAAVDVVTDALLLASCDALVHADSNVTSAVAYAAPDLEMMHVVDLLAPPAASPADRAGGAGQLVGEREGTADAPLAPADTASPAERSAARLPMHYVQRGYAAGQRDRADYV